MQTSIGEKVFKNIRNTRKYLEKNLKSFTLYQSCADLPIQNFHLIFTTNNLKYLVIGYDGYNDVKIPKGANERWQEIRQEWVKLVDDNETAYYFQLSLECMYLKTRYDVSGLLLQQIYTRELDQKVFDAYLEALEAWNYKWNRKATIINEVHRLLKQRKASKNKLNSKLSELEGYKERFKENDEGSLEKQAVILEQITGKNNIDVKTTSVRKWIEICKLATSINEQRRKNGK